MDLDSNSLATALTELPKSYFTFKPNMLYPMDQTQKVQYLRDPYGSSYGYSTAYHLGLSSAPHQDFATWNRGAIA